MLLKTIKSKKDIFYLINKYSGVIPRVEAEMLLEYLFNCARIDLYIRDFVVNATIEELYDSLASRCLNGEPVQYVTGHAEFMGLDFIVTKDTFIPRQETEILVNEILGLVNQTPANKVGAWFTAPKILDLCTGSGNIAISLAKLMPQAEIVATDISEDALRIAEKNAARHNVSDRIKFYKGNIFNALVFDINPKFDIMVCNPPYIKDGDLPYLQKEVRKEPEIALNAGKDGLDFYRIIAKDCRRYLKKSGSILLEIGIGQIDAIVDIFHSYTIFEVYKIKKDFAGIDRVIWCKAV